jgi:hypothetical protein
VSAETPYRDPAASLGDLSMAFQELENGLIIVFASLVDPKDDRVGFIIASQLSFRRLVALVDAVGRHRTKRPDLIGQMESLLKESSLLEQERNKYIHSFYDFREIAGERVTYERMKNRIKAGKGFSPDYEMLDTGKVDAITERLRILIAAVDLFFERLQREGIIRDRLDYH